MATLKKTPRAERDLDEIWDYIANDSVAAADRMIRRIESGCERAARNPSTGERRLGFFLENLRSFSVRKYVVYYIPIEDGILVVRVLHGARDHGPLLP